MPCEEYPFDAPGPTGESCKKLTSKRGNPDWADPPDSPLEPCSWPRGHGGPCNADPWADLLETELADEEANKGTD